MTGWFAGLVLVGLPLCAVATGLSLAALTGHRRRWWALGGLGVGILAIGVVSAVIPGFAADLQSAILSVFSADTWSLAAPGAAAGDGDTDSMGWMLGWLTWWRGLFEIEAWHSMGFVVVPLAIVILPLFLWQITRLHVDD